MADGLYNKPCGLCYYHGFIRKCAHEEALLKKACKTVLWMKYQSSRIGIVNDLWLSQSHSRSLLLCLPFH